MDEKIKRIIARYQKKSQKDEPLDKQEIEVWVIEEVGEEEVGEEEVEKKVTWTVIYNVAESWEEWGKEREFEVIKVLDEAGNEVDYKERGYTDKEIERLVEVASEPEEPAY